LNKEGKRLTQKNLPNRRNGNLYADIDFDVDANYKIQRKMESSTSSIKTELIIDTIPYKKANKIQDKINEKVIFDLKSFKSFISLNINIFKNFMSLTPEEKRILLDKLFNLEIINDLNKILKQLKTNNDNSFSSLKRELDIYKNNIDNLKTTIDNFITKNKNDKEEKIKSLKEVLNSNKENFLLLENNKNNIQETVEQNTEFVYELNNKISLYNKDISYINEKINLFKKGICPTCETKLIGELNLLPEFEERLKLTTELKLKLQKESDLLNTDLNEKKLELRKLNNDYNELLNYLSNIKTEIKLLKEVKEEDNVDEFKTNLKQQELKLEEKNNENKDLQKLKHIYDLLIPI
jgi:DNA repair exonuclease SbcCD ATPase subunit